MQIFGLTPTDTALSVLGLKVCQMLMNFIFKETAIGVVGGVLAYLLILWKLAKNGQFRRFGVYFVSLTVVILVLLPSRSLTQYTSAEERFGRLEAFTDREHLLFIKSDNVPVMYTFLSQGVDNIFIGIIAALDKVLPEWLKFLPQPFKIQEQVLYIREAIDRGIQDKVLYDNFNDFIHRQYLPAVTRFLTQNPKTTFRDIQFNSDVIRPFYSSEALQERQRLRVSMRGYLNQDEQLNERARSLLHQTMNINDEALIDVLINAFATSIILKDQHAKKNWFWGNIVYVIGTFPFIYGAAQMLLTVAFPFIVLLVLIGGKTTYLWHFIKSFFWIKSWVLSLAMSSYLSLSFARIQLSDINHSIIFFEQPMFSVVCVVLVFVFISLTRVVFLKGG